MSTVDQSWIEYAGGAGAGIYSGDILVANQCDNKLTRFIFEFIPGVGIAEWQTCFKYTTSEYKYEYEYLS